SCWTAGPDASGGANPFLKHPGMRKLSRKGATGVAPNPPFTAGQTNHDSRQQLPTGLLHRQGPHQGDERCTQRPPGRGWHRAHPPRDQRPQGQGGHHHQRRAGGWRVPGNTGQAAQATVRHRRHGQGSHHRDPGRPPEKDPRRPGQAGLQRQTGGGLTMASEALSAPYGGWKSPITAELINRGAPARDFPTRVAGVTYWQESRPEENGRITIVARDGEGREWDLLPYPYSARSRVHEYGGRAWVVAKDSLYFVEQSDQRVHRLSLHAPYQPPPPLTPEMGDTRFGEPVFDAVRGRLLCVMERHLPGEAEPRNCLATIALDGDDGADPVTIIASGADFYAAPTLDASGERLCWLCWNHPDMPWDGSELWRGEFAPDGTLVGATRVAGGRGEALFQPGWSPRGELCYVSDRRGWWNLHRLGVDGAECLLPMAADFAMPLWVLGMRTWGFLDADRIAALFT